MTSLLVVGSAPCLFADIARAKAIRSDVHLFLVNGACTVIEHAEHVLAGHTNSAELLARQRRDKYPRAKPWRLHATVVDKHLAEAVKTFPSVTDWWGKNMVTGATSIAKGARIGLAMGYREVILCGAPMDGSGYVEGEADPMLFNCRRVGDPAQQQHRSIIGYRTKFAERAREEFKGKVFSMSGFTRECLGEPEEF